LNNVESCEHALKDFENNIPVFKNHKRLICSKCCLNEIERAVDYRFASFILLKNEKVRSMNYNLFASKKVKGCITCPKKVKIDEEIEVKVYIQNLKNEIIQNIEISIIVISEEGGLSSTDEKQNEIFEYIDKNTYPVIVNKDKKIDKIGSNESLSFNFSIKIPKDDEVFSHNFVKGLNNNVESLDNKTLNIPNLFCVYLTISYESNIGVRYNTELDNTIIEVNELVD